MDLVLIHPETSSDTFQTPSRIPDTTQAPPAKGVLCNIGHWKKRQYLSFMTFTHGFGIDTSQTPRDTLQSGVWMVSGMCLRRSQDVSIPNPLANKKHLNKLNYAIILGYSPFLGKSGWCLGGV